MSHALKAFTIDSKQYASDVFHDAFIGYAGFEVLQNEYKTTIILHGAYRNMCKTNVSHFTILISLRTPGSKFLILFLD